MPPKLTPLLPCLRPGRRPAQASSSTSGWSTARPSWQSPYRCSGWVPLVAMDAMGCHWLLLQRLAKWHSSAAPAANCETQPKRLPPRNCCQRYCVAVWSLCNGTLGCGSATAASAAPLGLTPGTALFHCSLQESLYSEIAEAAEDEELPKVGAALWALHGRCCGSAVCCVVAWLHSCCVQGTSAAGVQQRQQSAFWHGL